MQKTIRWMLLVAVLALITVFVVASKNRPLTVPNDAAPSFAEIISNPNQYTGLQIDRDVYFYGWDSRNCPTKYSGLVAMRTRSDSLVSDGTACLYFVGHLATTTDPTITQHTNNAILHLTAHIELENAKPILVSP